MHCSPGCVLVLKKKKGYMTPKRLKTTKSDFFPEQSDHFSHVTTWRTTDSLISSDLGKLYLLVHVTNSIKNVT